MKKLTLLLIAALATALPAASVQADAAEDAVKARTGYMRLIAFQMAQMGAMAKGETPYDAAKASVFASNLSAAAGMHNDAMWVQGSDTAALGDKTRALPEIWAKWSEFTEKEDDLARAATELASKAGSGAAAFGEAYKATGSTCGGCHKPFRGPAN